jgi:exosome complex component RRP4
MALPLYDNLNEEQDENEETGASSQDGRVKLVATVSGVVDKINKLISVRPQRARYAGEIGDVVVCRVLEVSPRRWKVDVNSRHDALLLLSAINLPGGVQRRRTTSDELNMRLFFVENDLISAEVQQFFTSDGAMALHTRSLKYGKLEGGVFLSVSPALIKRAKNHFHSLSCGVDIILGNNGYCWIAPTSAAKALADARADENRDPSAPVRIEPPSRHVRENVARIRNCIVALSKRNLLVHRDAIMRVFEASTHFPVHQLSLPDVIDQITINV